MLSVNQKKKKKGPCWPGNCPDRRTDRQTDRPVNLIYKIQLVNLNHHDIVRQVNLGLEMCYVGLIVQHTKHPNI